MGNNIGQLEPKPIVQITRINMEYWQKGWAYDPDNCVYENRNWRVFGMDEDGVERPYAQGATQAELDAWHSSDPLMGAIHRAMTMRLLNNPATRDGTLLSLSDAASHDGDLPLAVQFAEAMSSEGRAKGERAQEEASKERSVVRPADPGPDPVAGKLKGKREPKWKLVMYVRSQYYEPRVPYVEDKDPTP
jgi:hypothetical protein